MSVGMPRSVLSGTAHHGAEIIRRAIQQRRNAGLGAGGYAREYGADPYQQDDRYQRRLPPPPPAPPKPVPITPGGGIRIVGSSTGGVPSGNGPGALTPSTGGPGGAYTKKGVFEPYGYTQETGGRYSGFNTEGMLKSANEGRTNAWLADLEQQANDIEYGYAREREGIQNRVADQRTKAFESVKAEVPTYGELDPALGDAAYKAAMRDPAWQGLGPMTREMFDTLTVGYAPGQDISAPPIVPWAPSHEGQYAPISQAYQRAYGIPEPAPQTRPAGNMLTATTPIGPGPSRPAGSTGLDLMLGPYKQDALAGQTIPAGSAPPPYGSWAPSPQREPEQGPQYNDQTREVSYSPAQDWERAMVDTGARRQLEDLTGWERQELGGIDARYADARGDAAMYQDLLQNAPEQFYQDMLINGYGVDPNVAAGLYSPEWGRDLRLGEIQDQNQLNSAQLDQWAYDTYGVQYSDLPPSLQLGPQEPMSPQEQVSRRNAEYELQYGVSPDEAMAANEKADRDRTYGALGEGFGGLDPQAILDSADLTVEQAGSILDDPQFQAAYEDLLSTFDVDQGINEQALVGVLRDSYAENPAWVRLFKALRPDLVPNDFLTGPANTPQLFPGG